MAGLLLLPTVVLFGVQRVEERYQFRGREAFALPSAGSLEAPGRFGLEVRASGDRSFVIEYHALGVAWLVRVAKRGLEVPDTFLEGFSAYLDPLRTLPALAGLLVVAWLFAGPLARRKGSS